MKRWMHHKIEMLRYDPITGKAYQKIDNWIRTEEGEHICLLCGWEGQPVNNNASLIATAPEMLEALKAVFSAMDLTKPSDFETFEMIKSAIAKAEGK